MSLHCVHHVLFCLKNIHPVVIIFLRVKLLTSSFAFVFQNGFAVFIKCHSPFVWCPVSDELRYAKEYFCISFFVGNRDLVLEQIVLDIQVELKCLFMCRLRKRRIFNCSLHEGWVRWCERCIHWNRSIRSTCSNTVWESLLLTFCYSWSILLAYCPFFCIWLCTICLFTASNDFSICFVYYCWNLILESKFRLIFSKHPMPMTLFPSPIIHSSKQLQKVLEVYVSWITAREFLDS